jgi:CBS domain-containing protein
LEQDEEIRIKELMTSNIISVSFDTSVMEAARIMSIRDISSVLIKSRGEFVGILTDRDVINDVVALGLDPKGIKVGEIMSKPLITISEDASVTEAAERMRDNKIRRLVVKNKMRINGIISEFDIVRVEPELHFLIREYSRLGFRPSYSIKSRERSYTGFCEECGNFSEDLEKVNGRWICIECRT